MVAFTWGPKDTTETYVDLKAAVAEFVAMSLFVVIGCGTACGHGAFDGATRLVVAFAFGMAIMVLAYSVGHHSGGQINCAVTFSLCLGGKLSWLQGFANLIAQLLGSVNGAMLLCGIFPCGEDMTTTLGTNIVSDKYGTGNALFGEAFGTFLLCFVVYETAVTPLSSCGPNACIAIGFTVFLAHLLLLPMDGCSINPTRSFGPAIVSKVRGCDNYTEGGLGDLWIMWMGPLMGASVAALVQRGFMPTEAELHEQAIEKATAAALAAHKKWSDSMEFSEVVPGSYDSTTDIAHEAEITVHFDDAAEPAEHDAAKELDEPDEPRAASGTTGCTAWCNKLF